MFDPMIGKILLHFQSFLRALWKVHGQEGNWATRYAIQLAMGIGLYRLQCDRFMNCMLHLRPRGPAPTGLPTPQSPLKSYFVSMDLNTII